MGLLELLRNIRVGSPAKRRLHRRTTLSTCDSLELRLLPAATTGLLLDLNPNTVNLEIRNAEEFTAVGDKTFFVAETDATGEELWITDDTDSGTKLVRDISPGKASASPSDLTSFAQSLYFKTSQWQVGTGFWRTDGTAEETRAVEFDPDDNVIIVNSRLTVFGDGLYFTALCGRHFPKSYLYVIRDTQGALPERVSESPLDNYYSDRADAFSIAGNHLYLKAYQSYREVVWSVSADGTVEEIPATGVISGIGSNALFIEAHADLVTNARYRFHVSDGTRVGTHVFSTAEFPITGIIGSESVVSGGGFTWFVEDRADCSILWTTDGTPAGTSSVELPAAYRNTQEVAYSGETCYVLLRQFPGENMLLLGSDGTSQGTILVADEIEWPVTNGSFLRPFQNGLIVLGPTASFRGMWFTDGTQDGSRLAASFGPGGVGAFREVSLLGQNLFISPGPQPAAFWISDGTPEGLRQVQAASTKSSAPAIFFADMQSGNTIFSATNGGVRELWWSDGSASGTSVLHFAGSLIVREQLASSPFAARAGDGKTFLFLRSNNLTELWNLDSASGITQLVARFHTTSLADVRYVPCGGRIVFSVAHDSSGEELWVTDGTSNGTRRIREFPAGGSLSRLIAISALDDQRILFATQSRISGLELWSTDGSQGGTKRLKLFPHMTDPQVAFFMEKVGRKVLFSADDDIHGLELWSTEGTLATTELLADVAPGANSSLTAHVRSTDGRLYFVADDGRDGEAWWVSDATTHGTRRVLAASSRELENRQAVAVGEGGILYTAHPSGLYGSDLLALNGEVVTTLGRFDRLELRNLLETDVFFAGHNRLFFAVTDATNSTQLWISDGTVAGTEVLASGKALITVQSESGLNQFGPLRGSVIYSGWLSQFGYEPVVIRTEDVTDAAVQLRAARSAGRRQLTWNSIFGADHYEVELTNRLNPASGFVRLSTAAMSVAIPAEFNGGVVSVRVRGVSTSGIPGPWTSTLDVAVSEVPLIHPLLHESSQVPPQITWTNPDAGSVSEVWINDLDSNVRALHQFSPKATTLSTIGLAPSRYAVWIRATSHGQPTAWSLAKTFDILEQAPTIVSVATDPVTRRTSLEWTNVIGSSGYQIVIQRDDVPGSPQTVVDSTQQLTRTDFYLPPGRHFVQVRSRRPGRVSSEWSDRIQFLVRSAPAVTATVNGTELSWKQIPGSVGAELRIINSTTSEEVVHLRTSETRFALDQSLSIGTYRVEIRSRYADGVSSDWSVLSFERFAPPVQIVDGLEPTVDATPNIGWLQLPGATSYEVVVFSVAPRREVYRIANLTTNSHRISQILFPGAYTVWVRAHFASRGRSAWGSGDRLTIGEAPVVNVESRTISWNVIRGATRYEIWVNRLETSSSGTARILHEDRVFATSHQLQNLSHGRFRVWVRAIRDEAGQTYDSAWSRPVDFTGN